MFKIAYGLVRRMRLRNIFTRKEINFSAVDHPFISCSRNSVKIPNEETGNNTNGIVKDYRFEEFENSVNANVNCEKSTNKNGNKRFLETQKQNSSFVRLVSGEVTKKVKKKIVGKGKSKGKKSGGKSTNPAPNKPFPKLGEPTPTYSNAATTKSQSQFPLIPQPPATALSTNVELSPTIPEYLLTKTDSSLISPYDSPKYADISSTNGDFLSTMPEFLLTDTSLTNADTSSTNIPVDISMSTGQTDALRMNARTSPIRWREDLYKKIHENVGERKHPTPKQFEAPTQYGRADQTSDDDKDKLYDLLLLLASKICHCQHDCSLASGYLGVDSWDLGNCYRTPDLMTELGNICRRLERVTHEIGIYSGRPPVGPRTCYPQMCWRCYEPQYFDPYLHYLENLLDDEDYLPSLYNMDYLDNLF